MKDFLIKKIKHLVWLSTPYSFPYSSPDYKGMPVFVTTTPPTYSTTIEPLTTIETGITLSVLTIFMISILIIQIIGWYKNK